jgi:hypothetical protein
MAVSRLLEVAEKKGQASGSEGDDFLISRVGSYRRTGRQIRRIFTPALEQSRDVLLNVLGRFLREPRS